MLIITGFSAQGAEGRPETIEGKLGILESEITRAEAGSGKREDWRKFDLRFAALIAEEPGNLPLRLARAEFLWNQGQTSRALDEWRAVEKLNPRYAPVLSRLADYWLQAGNTRQAADYFAKAVENAPSEATYRFALANVTFLFRHDLATAKEAGTEVVLERALGHFSEASRLSPLNDQYARAYAETFYAFRSPDWAKALSAWEHFLEITPQKDFARVNLARIQLKLGNPEAAERVLSEIQDKAFDGMKARLRGKVTESRPSPSLAPEATKIPETGH